jgi:aconitase A
VNTDSELFDWDEKSTYIRKPDFLDTMDNKIGDIK